MKSYDAAISFAEEYEQNINDKASYVPVSDSILQYIDDSKPINGVLAGYIGPGDYDDNYMDDIKSDIKNISKSMKAMKESISLYRGIQNISSKSMFYGIKKGDIVSNNFFLSTSRNPETANNFASSLDRTNSAIIEIRTGHRTRAISVSNGEVEEFGSVEGEYEAILDLNQQFKVVDVIKNKSIANRSVGKYIVVDYVAPSKKVQKSREGTEWTRAHNLEFDEEKHRWVLPDMVTDGSDYANTAIIEIKDSMEQAIDSYRKKDWSYLEHIIEEIDNYAYEIANNYDEIDEFLEGFTCAYK